MRPVAAPKRRTAPMLQWNTKLTAILAVTALASLATQLANFTWHVVNFTW